MIAAGFTVSIGICAILIAIEAYQDWKRYG